jgi:hypothetical protein
VLFYRVVQFYSRSHIQLEMSMPCFAHANPGALAGGMLCGVGIAIAVLTLIGAVILRAACWLYNKMAGGQSSPSAVPEPDFGKAILISFVSMLVNFGAGVVLDFAGIAANIGQTGVNAISWPLCFIVDTVMIAAMLPTTIVRGLLVALIQYVVITIAAFGVLVVAGTIFGGFAFMNR